MFNSIRLFNNVFDELKEVKHLKEIVDFKSLIMQNTLRTQVSIYAGVFLWIYLTVYYVGVFSEADLGLLQHPRWGALW